MLITDAEFNAYFSIRWFGALIMPAIMTILLQRSKVNHTSLILVFCATCATGQALFALSMETENYKIGLFGRFLIGVAETQNIIQQTIICEWFPTNQLPMAFGSMLFLVKIVRTINDNVASHFYNQYGLENYQWVGFSVCIISLLFAVILTRLEHSINKKT